MTVSVEEQRALLEPNHPELRIRRQCALLGRNRASYYYQAQPSDPLNLELLRRSDQQYMATPFYGVPRMTAVLRAQGDAVKRNRVRRLMRQRGIPAVMRRKRPATSTPGHRVSPDLRREQVMDAPNQVWCADSTDVPMPLGFVYRVAIMDWFSRDIGAGEVSTSLEGSFCCAALDRALLRGKPTIVNTDQGSQCTAQAFTSRLETGGVPISMDGRGPVFDTIVSARFWRSVNDAHLDRHDSQTVPAVVAGVRGSMDGYNTQRLHQRLAYRTPAAVYGAGYAGANLARQPQRSRPVKTTRSMVGGVGTRGLDSAC